MSNEKKQLRRYYLKNRKEFLSKDSANSAITQKLIGECGNCQKIFVYISYGSEVDTKKFIQKMFSLNKEVYVPVCDIPQHTMEACQIHSLSNLKMNEYGILEPKIVVHQVPSFDVIVFPGAVFDVHGHRIGYGKGYYDKFVSSLDYSPKKIGICYDLQLSENSIPHESHDVKMDMILTESRKIVI